jgi:hypothetical protein
MAISASTASPLLGSVGRPVERVVVRGSATVVAWAGCAAGLLLLTRRIATSLGPAGPGAILATTAAGVVLVQLVDAVAREQRQVLAAVAARCGLVAAVLALVSLSQPRRIIDWTALAVAIVAGTLTVARWPGRPEPATHTRNRPSGRGRAPGARRRPSPPVVQPGRVMQSFVRYQASDGADRFEGRITIPVPQGARLASGHVAFCPTFDTMPRVDVATRYDGVEVAVAAAEILPWGVRIDCRLSEAAEDPLEIPVDLAAWLPAAGSALS